MCHLDDHDPATPPVGPATAPGWVHQPTHVAWLDAELRRLLAFSRDPTHPLGGFAELDEHGTARPDRPVHTWITGRMTHVHALGALLGVPGCGTMADHGVRALTSLLHDQQYGGWFAAVAPDGTPTGRKDAYQHAFVVLAACSATAAGRPGAADVLADALHVYEMRFHEPATGRFVESFARGWSDPEPYRGANSNMHAVEACLAAGDVTGERRWHDHALVVAEALIDQVARAHGWHVVEHFDAAWRPLPDHNRDQPTHPFRPYGATIGHGFEWARLLLQLEASLPAPPDWLEPAARAMFDVAAREGWAADGTDGFVYTVDWDGRAVGRARMHWVVCEAIAAAAALHRRTGEARYEAWYRRAWDHAARWFLDPVDGSWHHELDDRLRPTAGTWAGKPDLYHAVQATLLPTRPLAPSLATQLATAAG